MRSSSSEVSSPALYGDAYQSMFIGRALPPAELDEIIPLIEIDIGLLAHQVAVSATDTLDLRQGVHDFLLAIDL